MKQARKIKLAKFFKPFFLVLVFILAAAIVNALPTNHSRISDATPDFSWTWTDNATTNYTLVIDDSSNMASPILSVYNISGTSYTLNDSEQLIAEGLYYWNVMVYDNGSYLGTISSSDFYFDITAPTIVMFTPSNLSWINQTSISVTVITNEDSQCKYSTVSGVPYVAKTSMSGSGTVSHTATFSLSSQNINSYYVQCQDNLSNQINLSNEVNYSLRLDNIGPASGTVLINSGAIYTNINTVTLSWSGFSDTYQGVKYYYYSNINNGGTRTGTQVNNITSSVPYLGLSEGTNNLYVWAEDGIENIGSASSSSIIYDITAPLLRYWSETPTTLRHYYTAALNISAEVYDSNFLSLNPPQCRYRFYYPDTATFNTSYTIWANMSLFSGTTYWYAINENWEIWQGHTIYYECRVYDAVNLIYNTTRTKPIYMNNNPPSFVNLSSFSGTQGINASVILTGYDFDGNSLTFTSNSNFTITELSTTSVAAWIVPPNSMVGTSSVIFYVTDGTYIRNGIITSTVNPVNDAPILDAIGNLEAYVHKPFLRVIISSDPDNENNYLFDDDMHIFGTVENISWFRLTSGYNISTGKPYGIINFTPLSSQSGRHNFTIYASDGEARDTETITFTVGFCGDYDETGEPKCDSDYETCSNCEQDCGKCDTSTNSYMTIIVPQKNCINTNFTMQTFKLVERGTCSKKGGIVNDLEICGNISDVTITVYMLENKEWVEQGQYTTDDAGRVSFVPTISGSYKLVGVKRSYVSTNKYLDFGACLSTSTNPTNNTGSQITQGQTGISNEIQTNKNGKDKIPIKDEPGAITDEENIVEDSPLYMIILWYAVIPVLLISFIGVSFVYYQKNKDNVAWILKLRILMYNARNRVLNLFRKNKEDQ